MKVVCIISLCMIGVKCGLLDDLVEKKHEDENKDRVLAKVVNALDDGVTKVVVTVSNTLNLDLNKKKKEAASTETTKTNDLGSTSTTEKANTDKKLEENVAAEVKDKAPEEEKVKDDVKSTKDGGNKDKIASTTETVAKNCTDKDCFDEAGMGDDQVTRTALPGDECPKGFGRSQGGSCRKILN